MTRFDVEGRLATHSGVVIWKARDTGLDRLVALKEIDGPSSAEARALAGLSSPHLVQFYDVVEDGGRTYLVEEWIDGATVRDVVHASGRLTTAQALAVVRGALLGLIDMHRAGKVHGDVSPGNILVDGKGTSRLIDFGSVVSAGSAARASTRSFASPEARQGGALTPASDVYAAAAVLALLLHGRDDLTPSTDGVEQPVRAVLDKALDADPAQRYRDAAEFLAALEDAARTRYGAGWWSQAGFAALVTAATAGVSANLAGAPFTASAGHPVASAASAQTPPVDRTNDPTKPGNRRGRLVAAGAAVVLLAAGTAIAVAASAGKKKATATGTTTPTGAATVSASTSVEPTATATATDGPQNITFHTVSGAINYRLVKKCDTCEDYSGSGSVPFTADATTATFYKDTQTISVNLSTGDGHGSTLVIQGPLAVGSYPLGALPADYFVTAGVTLPKASGSGEQVFGADVKGCSLELTSVSADGASGSVSCPEAHDPPPPAFEAPPGYTYALDATFSFAP